MCVCMQQVNKIRKKQAILSHNRRADSDFLLRRNQLMPVKAGRALHCIANSPPSLSLVFGSAAFSWPWRHSAILWFQWGLGVMFGQWSSTVGQRSTSGPQRGSERLCVSGSPPGLPDRMSEGKLPNINSNIPVFPKGFVPSIRWGLTLA